MIRQCADIEGKMSFSHQAARPLQCCKEVILSCSAVISSGQQMCITFLFKIAEEESQEISKDARLAFCIALEE